MKERKTFWDKNAGRYDRFMRKDRAAYEEMYKLIRPVVKAKTVLELATGTGLIAKHIVNAAAHIEATDASAEMIAINRHRRNHRVDAIARFEAGVDDGAALVDTAAKWRDNAQRPMRSALIKVGRNAREKT